MTETPNLRESLLRRYRDLQGAQSSGSLYADPSLAWPHYDANYWHWLERFPKSATVVELGSGSGSLLGWLRSKGFEDLRGVDLSPDDVRFANDYLGGEYVLESDGAAYLGGQAGKVDVIVAKAIVEHIAKADLIGLLDAMAGALRPNGMVLIEVPNMDWLLSGHERYMDLTHEVGFTRESLATLLLLRFRRRRGARFAAGRSNEVTATLAAAARRRDRRALYVVGEGASDVLFAHRSLVARASTPKSVS